MAVKLIFFVKKKEALDLQRLLEDIKPFGIKQTASKATSRRSPLANFSCFLY